MEITGKKIPFSDSGLGEFHLGCGSRLLFSLSFSFSFLQIKTDEAKQAGESAD